MIAQYISKLESKLKSDLEHYYQCNHGVAITEKSDSSIRIIISSSFTPQLKDGIDLEQMNKILTLRLNHMFHTLYHSNSLQDCDINYFLGEKQTKPVIMFVIKDNFLNISKLIDVIFQCFFIVIYKDVTIDNKDDILYRKKRKLLSDRTELNTMFLAQNHGIGLGDLVDKDVASIVYKNYEDPLLRGLFTSI